MYDPFTAALDALDRIDEAFYKDMTVAATLEVDSAPGDDSATDSHASSECPF